MSSMEHTGYQRYAPQHGDFSINFDPIRDIAGRLIDPLYQRLTGSSFAEYRFNRALKKMTENFDLEAMINRIGLDSSEDLQHEAYQRRHSMDRCAGEAAAMALKSYNATFPEKRVAFNGSGTYFEDLRNFHDLFKQTTHLHEYTSRWLADEERAREFSSYYGRKIVAEHETISGFLTAHNSCNPEHPLTYTQAALIFDTYTIDRNGKTDTIRNHFRREFDHWYEGYFVRINACSFMELMRSPPPLSTS